MAYATQSDLVPLRLTTRQLAELTSEVGVDVVDTTIVDADLAEASARVESYCRQRYRTPLQPSLDVKSLTLDITVFLLYKRRPGMLTAEVRDSFDAAIRFLKDIAKGDASLDQPVDAAAPQASSGGAVVTQIPQTFSDDNLRGF